MTRLDKVLVVLHFVLNTFAALVCSGLVWLYSGFYLFENHVPHDLGGAETQMTFSQVATALGIVAASTVAFALAVAYGSAVLFKAMWGEKAGRRLTTSLAVVVWLTVAAGPAFPVYEFFHDRAPYF